MKEVFSYSMTFIQSAAIIAIYASTQMALADYKGHEFQICLSLYACTVEVQRHLQQCLVLRELFFLPKRSDILFPCLLMHTTMMLRQIAMSSSVTHPLTNTIQILIMSIGFHHSHWTGLNLNRFRKLKITITSNLRTFSDILIAALQITFLHLRITFFIG